MKYFRQAVFLLLIISVICPSISARMVSNEDARIVATNWINQLIYLRGSWNNASEASVAEVLPLNYEGRMVGYYCRIVPGGHIIVSLYEGLAPVKAYSVSSTLDPEDENGMADMIKLKMAGIIGTIEDRLGPLDKVSNEALRAILEIDYTDAWDYFLEDVTHFRNNLPLNVSRENYQEGDTLLASSWHQGDPYYDQCPAPDPGDNCFDPHCAVGCVATAGAQLMHYWCWPPYGDGSPYNDPIDWTLMPDTLKVTSSQAEIDETAEFCHEVGLAVGMDYCWIDCQSGVATSDMAGAYEGPYRYAHAVNMIRRNGGWGANGWWDRILIEINVNRPIHYRVIDHSIVCDGWQILPPDTRQYHMNYGWNNGANDWYTLDALLLGGVDEEYMLRRIYPENSFLGTVSGGYEVPSFPYRYVDQDAVGEDAYIYPGQSIQFLPNITLTGTATAETYRIYIHGTSDNNTLLFTRGDETVGLRIYDGALTLKNGGSIVFR